MYLFFALLHIYIFDVPLEKYQNTNIDDEHSENTENKQENTD